MEKQYQLGDEVYVLFKGGAEYPFIEKVTVIGAKYKRDSKVIQYECKYTEKRNNECLSDTDSLMSCDIHGDLGESFNLINYELNIKEIDRRQLLEKRKQELGIK